ncbi:ATP-dependent DNA helicase PIF1 [Elysia marginata]|uniref:ATP-dependent DNA helicase PIF1 n=1 Tax=Elysia marginata TaxID=1093978 RepID=A0AAV4H510_9GAST|nr:ATP-dependent DNA helicase PIF1 [Elysia marginata]
MGIVEATLKASYLWQFATKLKLTQSMGAKLLEESSLFADYLLSIGDGRVEQHNEKGFFFIKFPDDITVPNEKEPLDFVFGGIEDKYTDSAWLAARSVQQIVKSMLSTKPSWKHFQDKNKCTGAMIPWRKMNTLLRS